MKMIATNTNRVSRSIGQVRDVVAGQSVLAQIATARENILAESREALQAPDRLLRLAVNEAEALAWQTPYPQLVFPVLATEKVLAVAAWNAAQESVRGSSPVFTLTE